MGGGEPNPPNREILAHPTVVMGIKFELRKLCEQNSLACTFAAGDVDTGCSYDSEAASRVAMVTRPKTHV